MSLNLDTIDTIDSSLNFYQSLINNYEISLNHIEGNDDGEFDYYKDKISNASESVSDFLKGLGFQVHTSNDIATIDNHYKNFYDNFKKSNDQNKNLKSLVSKYEATEAKLSNSKKTDTYLLLFIWIVIFMFIAVALFLSIIEDKKKMNIFSKSLLIFSSLIIFFLVVKNLKFYIERI